MTHQIDSLANLEDAQNPGEYLAAVRAFKKEYPFFSNYGESDWETAVEAEDVEAEDNEDITNVVDDCLEVRRRVAEGVALFADPDKLDEDITEFIMYAACMWWVVESHYNKCATSQVVGEYLLWAPDDLSKYLFPSPSAWWAAVQFYGFSDSRYQRINNYRSALNIRPRIKPHPPFPQWYEEALAYPLPDEHPDVLERFHRKMFEESLSRVVEQLEGNEMFDEYVLQTAFNPAFCPGIKPQVETRGRTGTLLTPQLASPVSQVEEADSEELLPSTNEARPGRIPDKLIQKRKEIVRELMTTPVDFQNREKVSTVFKRLDTEQIPLPKWNGSLRNWQPKTWKELLEKLRSLEYQKRISLLKRDLYPQRQG